MTTQRQTRLSRTDEGCQCDQERKGNRQELYQRGLEVFQGQATHLIRSMIRVSFSPTYVRSITSSCYDKPD